MKFKDETERAAYIDGELKKVTSILDGIARDTGVVFVAIRALAAADLVKVARRTIKAMTESSSFIEKRVDLARVHYAGEEKTDDAKKGD